MPHSHEPRYHLRPEGGKPGLPLEGITYVQALDKARELSIALRKRVYVEGVTTLASQDPPR